MNRLSLLMWLAIVAAVIPLLAVPLWLMKTAVIVVALTMAGTTYSLIHQSDSRTEPALAEQKHIAAGFHPQTVSAKADESVDVKAENDQGATQQQSQQERNPQSSQDPENLTEDELKRQFFNTKGKPKSAQGNTENSRAEDSEPINVTDPNSDRFIAVNTYKSRSNRLRS